MTGKYKEWAALVFCGLCPVLWLLGKLCSVGRNHLLARRKAKYPNASVDNKEANGPSTHLGFGNVSLWTNRKVLLIGGGVVMLVMVCVLLFQGNSLTSHSSRATADEEVPRWKRDLMPRNESLARTPRTDSVPESGGIVGFVEGVFTWVTNAIIIVVVMIVLVFCGGMKAGVWHLDKATYGEGTANFRQAYREEYGHNPPS